MRGASSRNIDPDKLIWLVVGDRAKVEAGLRALNIGPVEVRAAATPPAAAPAR